MQSEPLPSEGSFDPYGRIREKINAGSKKFKEYKDQPCCPVLYNVNVPLVELHAPDVMFGAMEGDYGLLIPINTTTRRADERGMRNIFLDVGKMINPKTNHPQNTTISALITLRYLYIGSMRYRKYYRDSFNLAKGRA